MAASQSTLCCVLHACTAILFCVIPFDCSFVLAQSFLQHSSSFSNVHAFTFSTGHLLHNSSFLLRWLWLLCLYQDFAECSSRLHITSSMDLVHSANFFKLHAVCAFLHHTASSTIHSTSMYQHRVIFPCTAPQVNLVFGVCTRHCGWCTT